MKILIYFSAYLTLVVAGGRGYLPKGGAVNHGHSLGNTHGGNSFGVVPQSKGVISNAGYGNAASFGPSSSHDSGFSTGHSQGVTPSLSTGFAGNGWNAGHSGVSQGLNGGFSSGFGGHSHGASNSLYSSSSLGLTGGSSFGEHPGFSQGIESSSADIGFSSHGSGVSQSLIAGSSHGNGWSTGQSSLSQGISSPKLSSKGSGWNTGYSGLSRGSISQGLNTAFKRQNSGHSKISHRLNGGSSFGGQSTSFTQGPIRGPSSGFGLSSHHGSGSTALNVGVSQGLIEGSPHGRADSGISYGINSSSYGQGHGSGSKNVFAKNYRPSKVLNSVPHGGSSSYPVEVAATSYGLGHTTGRISSPISGAVSFNSGHGGSFGGVSGSSRYEYYGNSAAAGFGNAMPAGGVHHGGSSSHVISNRRYASDSLGGSWAVTKPQFSWSKSSW
ncbi:hornerin-like [Eupeodes corollae]|uniref:hornerin-like n=1 Tax=Eupeodes corollae TaxID=290404 RepID=UPI00249329F5|nr:hornerin-like [Eupeodes corollae]